MDLSAIGTALSSLKVGTELAQLIRDSGINLKQAEINSKLTDLINALSEARLQLVEVREGLAEKDAAIRVLQRRLAGDVFFRAPFHWSKKEDGSEDGPFCPACYDGKGGQQTRLHEYMRGWHDCKVCGARYEDRARSDKSNIGQALRDYDPFGS